MNVIDLIVVRQVQYLNTIIEQDHLAIELVTSRCSTQSVPVGRLRAKRCNDQIPGKKDPEILTFVGLPDFLNCYKNGGSCGIRTYDQLVKSQLLYQLS